MRVCWHDYTKDVVTGSSITQTYQYMYVFDGNMR